MRSVCACALLLVAAHPAFADPPPIGYTGPVPHAPPIGYTGVVPSSWSGSTPPVGYTGVVISNPPAPELPVQSVVAPEPIAPITSVSVPPKTSDPLKRKEETLISASHMSFDQNANIATAAGHVEIARGGYVLHADKVTYDQTKDLMRAEGHVAVLHPDGEVSFAEAEEITGDMKQAFANNIGVLFPDNSRMAARSGQRYDGRYLVAQKGAYTSCNVCLQDPDHPPLWQMRAEEIVHDNETHDIYYHDATLDFAGTPVLYTPYLSTPDPTVDRRQGFLAPITGRTPEAGYFARVPYYFDISADKDALLAPTFSTNDIPMFGGEYRERFVNGNLILDGTLGYSQLLSENDGESKGDRLRGDLVGKFVYNLNSDWRTGTDVDYVSDKSYLERYDLGSPGSTFSRAYLENFHGRDYAAVNGYYFQDLAPGTQPVQPAILPSANFSMLGEPGQTLGGRWSLNGSALVTARDNNDSLPLSDQGPQTRRLSLAGDWQRQLISDTGLVTTVEGLLRGDTYWADNVISPTNSGQVFNNVLIGRQFEQANLTESYPLARHGDGYQQTVEPIVMLTAAPQVRPDPRQPIEDSLDVQFDETNLFAANRFTGNDLIEGGNRVTYGVRQSVVADGGAHFDVFGGQSYDFTRNGEFPELSGLHDHTSDYVGRISASPGSWLDTDYGFRFSHQDFSPEAQDAHLSFGVPAFRPSFRYVLAFQTQTTGEVDTVEEAIGGFSSVIAKYWTFTFAHTQAFQPSPGPRLTVGSLNYADECFIAGVDVQRNDTDRFDIRPGTSVLFHILLRNLGGIRTDSTSGLRFPSEFRQPQ